MKIPKTLFTYVVKDSEININLFKRTFWNDKNFPKIFAFFEIINPTAQEQEYLFIFNKKFELLLNSDLIRPICLWRKERWKQHEVSSEKYSSIVIRLFPIFCQGITTSTVRNYFLKSIYEKYYLG